MTILAQARRIAVVTAAGFALALGGVSASAQAIQTIDPDAVIDGDIEEAPGDGSVYAPAPTTPPSVDEWNEAVGKTGPAPDAAEGSPNDMVLVAPAWSDPSRDAAAEPAADAKTTYSKDDLIGAAGGLFGDGAEGLALMIEGWLSKQGEPNGYIVGREAGGAFVVGARYGSGTLFHKVEGERPVYWTGPSIGFDVGANAGKTFVLVYNLYDTEELYERFPQGEGQLYVVGGLTASYLRKGDVVLIPIRMGAGLRLGVNAGYMKFSKKQRWLPF
ncbi:MAG: DUF1134 domain-containing protein [Sphingomonadaceae bacterium]|nr:DUF1134 domain-containing protein [Sphingomonadaceae bacterium]